ncbi:MAG: hypothetical protein OXN44_03655 [Acidimicrobiaceae bacterium]|nr:hypothetical protein [Acidimicrobiaceae bacterium]
MLRALERLEAPAVTAVGLVEDRWDDPGAERSAALITRFAAGADLGQEAAFDGWLAAGLPDSVLNPKHRQTNRVQRHEGDRDPR